MQKTLLAVLFSLCSFTYSQAQDQISTTVTDGFDLMMKRAAQANPNFMQDLRQLHADIHAKTEMLLQPNNAYKTTAVKEVPIVFHVLLTQPQIDQLGGTVGIEARIKSQVEVLNQDFNAANPDNTKIPAAFKPLYGNANIKFMLAHKDPKGQYSAGYEIIVSSKNGYDIQGGTTGSTYYCSDAKYASSGGAEAWDTKKYINVWVLNITPTGVGGAGTPPPYDIYGGTSAFPWAEQGIVLSYMGFGKKTDNSQYFPLQAAKVGRTLVHEMGHYFNLFHPFGISTMDNKDCLDDDGVSDTPLEAGPVQSTCPSFPLLDVCNPNMPGVMFMNHMDYTADSCRHMFTHEQAARMNVELATGGYREGLTSDPTIIYNWPTSVTDANETGRMMMYPNPASGYFTMQFSGELPATVTVTNAMGQVVKTIAPNSPTTTTDISGLAKGIYIIKCAFKDHTVNQKLLVN
jgi:hypothetical protein